MELGQLAEALQTVHALLIGPNAGSRARALAADGSFAAQLVTCMVVGTTWLCRLSELTEVQRQLALEALAVVTNTAHALDASMRHSVATAASAVAFARALLRTHTLQRLSRFCAAATAYLQGIAAALEAPAATEAAPQEACVWGCVKALGMVPALISNLATLARTATQAALAPPPPADLAPQREWRRLEVAKRVLVSEFASHLGASGVFGHLARALVTAGVATAAAIDAGDEDLQVTLEVGGPMCLNAILCNVSSVVELCQAVSPDTAATLREAMAGPCFRHLVLSAGLAALCWADGGLSYGLPDALLDGLPVLGSNQAVNIGGVQDVRQMEHDDEPALLCPKIFHVLTGALGPGAAAVPLLPLVGPRAAVSLLLRVGGLALESFQAWGQADSPDKEAGESYYLLGPPWAMEQLVILWASLRSVDVLLPPPAGSGWAKVALAERWRLAVGAVKHLTPWLEGADRRSLAQVVAEPLGQGELASPDGSLPAAPSPAVAAALEAGLVPALTDLARSAGGGQREASLLIQVLSYEGRSFAMLGRLFTYGQPAETAGFLVSVAELLRRCKVPPTMIVPALQRRDGTWDPTLGVGLTTSLSMLYRGLSTDLLAAYRPISAAATVGGNAAAAPHPALERLTTALAASAVLWLPEQGRLGREFMMKVSDPWAESSSHSSHVTPPAAVLAFLVEGVLTWIELLPFLPDSHGAPSGGRPAAEAGAGGSGSGARGGASTGGGGGWRRFLVEEVGAVPLLAAALRLAPKWKPSGAGSDLETTDFCMARLATACAAVAVTVPEAVQHATRTGVAASSASSATRAQDCSSVFSEAQHAAAWQPQHLEDLASTMPTYPEYARLALAVGRVVAEWGRGGTVAGPQLSELREGLCERLCNLHGCDVEAAARALPTLEEVRAMVLQAGASRS